MVEILSRRDGPRREDAAARHAIKSNWGTIEKLADQISQGGYSASKRAARSADAPRAEGKVICDMGAPRPAAEPAPYVRVSPNRRVVVVDYETGRQMHHLGEIRRRDGEWRFTLATRANGFFAPVDTDVAGKLAALDGAALGADRDEAALAAEIASLLGYA
ncbi:MAG: hypothetical protein EA355_13350 [Rhodobacteraceae bacterium]|nr:MAG: hypothetical protein EA355_13350 [Paracoccaceae bacterium]